MRILLIAAIKCYQWVLSPYMGRACRFYPSCSHYAIEAIEVHGAGKGTWLAMQRILRCQPLGKSGFDPVPPPKSQAPKCLDHHHAPKTCQFENPLSSKVGQSAKLTASAFQSVFPNDIAQHPEQP